MKNIYSSTPDRSDKPSFFRLPIQIACGIFIAIAILITVVLMILGGGSILINQQSGEPVVGKYSPDFELTAFDGPVFRLSELSGKVIVLNFWASWCKPCEQEAVNLESAWRYYQPRGDVIFLGAAWTDTEKKSLEYLNKFDITYPNGPDLGTRISQDYRTIGVPETFIIDKQGKIAYMRNTPFESLAEIQQIIDSILE